MAALGIAAGEELRAAPGCRVVEHVVAPGQTMEVIAATYGVKAEVLLAVRGADHSLEPAPGSRLLVPVPLDRVLPVKMREALCRQVALDRVGFVPGKLDGVEGKFTRLVLRLAQEAGAAAPFEGPAVVLAKAPEGIDEYVDPTLPGSGSAPDFKVLSGEQRRPLKYRRRIEFLAERWHCAERLLEQLNPDLEIETIAGGRRIAVPNVEPFRIEEWLEPDGKPKRSLRAEDDGAQWVVSISLARRLLQVWREGMLVGCFPVTVNEAGSPLGLQTLGRAVAGPPYFRRKTGFDLLPGPNSPVGVAWCPIGDGFGIHGTCDPRWIGRNTSAGCIRLANWDVVRFGALVPPGALVVIG